MWFVWLRGYRCLFFSDDLRFSSVSYWINLAEHYKINKLKKQKTVTILASNSLHLEPNLGSCTKARLCYLKQCISTTWNILAQNSVIAIAIGNRFQTHVNNLIDACCRLSQLHARRINTRFLFHHLGSLSLSLPISLCVLMQPTVKLRKEIVYSDAW